MTCCLFVDTSLPSLSDRLTLFPCVSRADERDPCPSVAVNRDGKPGPSRSFVLVCEKKKVEITFKAQPCN